MPFQADPRPLPGDFLMERDAARLREQEADPGRPASLLLYRWERPTLSLGHGQSLEADFDLESIRRAELPWVRRPTGGRAILHADEWTFSVVGGLADVRFGGTLRETYTAVSTVVRAALLCLGAALDPPGAGRPQPATEGARSACFAAAWGHEITGRGGKLVGSAQRRGRRAFLQQGTILVGPGHAEIVRWMRLRSPERERLRTQLETSTVTVSDLLGAPPEYARFAACLAEAWAAAEPCEARLSLDREGAEL